MARQQREQQAARRQLDVSAGGARAPPCVRGAVCLARSCICCRKWSVESVLNSCRRLCSQELSLQPHRRSRFLPPDTRRSTCPGSSRAAPVLGDCGPVLPRQAGGPRALGPAPVHTSPPQSVPTRHPREPAVPSGGRLRTQKGSPWRRPSAGSVALASGARVGGCFCGPLQTVLALEKVRAVRGEPEGVDSLLPKAL